MTTADTTKYHYQHPSPAPGKSSDVWPRVDGEPDDLAIRVLVQNVGQVIVWLMNDTPADVKRVAATTHYVLDPTPPGPHERKKFMSGDPEASVRVWYMSGGKEWVVDVDAGEYLVVSPDGTIDPWPAATFADMHLDVICSCNG